MNPDDFSKLVHAHAWIAIALAVMPLLDRSISKDEWPWKGLGFTTRSRFLLIAFGGGVVGALQHFQSGDAWVDSVVSGLFAVVFTVMKNGESLFASPESVAVPKRVSVPPLPMLVLCVVLAACAGWKQEAKTVLDQAKTVCILANALIPTPDILAACNLLAEEAPVVEAIVGEHKAQLKARAVAGVCK